jgi:steroid delta-isomerase-like uncharacterized protein
MSTQESLQVIGAYFQNHEGQYLAENVEFCDMTAEQPLRGREAMQRALDLFYSEAFSEAFAETRNVVAADNGVVIEFVFHGTHTGELEGIAPTGKVVALPMCAYYSVAHGQIQLVRLYYDTATMRRQLGLLS